MDPEYDEEAGEIEAIADDTKSKAGEPGNIHLVLPEWAMDRVLEAAGHKLAQDAKNSVTEIIVKRVDAICNEAFVAEITKRAHETAVAYLDKPRQRTNEWGESLGGAVVTWSENIPKTVEAYLNAKVDREGRTEVGYARDHKSTRLDWLMQQHVTSQLKVETEKAAKDVTEQARVIVSQHVGRFISEQMIPAIDVLKV